MLLPISDGRVLETAFGILAAVVEDTRLLVDVVKFERLELTAFTELNVLQTLDINDDAIGLCFCDCLLNLQVRKLKLVCKTMQLPTIDFGMFPSRLVATTE